MTAGYSQKKKEVTRLIEYYFRDKEIQGKVFLDAGCRVGDYANVLVEKGASKVVGVDISSKCISVAKARYGKNKKFDFQEKDITDLKTYKESQFDHVICIGTIFYLEPSKMAEALREFIRITKPGGTILVLFQKKKGMFGNVARIIANSIPLHVYFFCIRGGSYFLLPFMKRFAGREMSREYFMYDVLLSLRGIHFGVPFAIPSQFRLETVTVEQCSEKTSTSYKIVVPKEKGKLYSIFN